MKYAQLGLALSLVALGSCTTKSTAAAPAKTAESKPRGEASLGSAVPPDARATDPHGSATDAHGPAADAGGKSATPSLHEAVEYWDGTTRRKLWLSEDLVVEFDPCDAGRDAIRAQDPSAEEVPQPQKSARMWRLSKGLRAGAFARTASSGPRRISPVLHEGPSPNLPMRGLPGGVLVTFAAGWDRARVDAWLAARGLHVEGEAVVAEANLFLVATPPGLESLRVADDLHASGELADVAPNFWLQNATR